MTLRSYSRSIARGLSITLSQKTGLSYGCDLRCYQIVGIFVVDCVRASGTYVTMSQGQWQHTQQYTTTYVYVVVGAYACCHLSRYIVSVMSCTLVLSPQLFLHHSIVNITECFTLIPITT